MNFDLRAALKLLGEGAAFRIANAATPGQQYLYALVLPEVQRSDYTASAGNMTVIATMAGLVGMDSPYPPGGAITASEFAAKVAKIAQTTTLPEEALRELHAFLNSLRGNGATVQETNQAAAEQVLNFIRKIVVQPHMDTMEWLRGQALLLGRIDWIFNDTRLLVDYKVPAGNFLPHRVGADGYGGAQSKFWQDVRTARRILKSVRVFMWHSETREMVLANPANNIRIITMDERTVRVTKMVGANERDSDDPRDTVTFVTYDGEAQVLDPATGGRTTKPILFMPHGVILGVGNRVVDQFIVGQTQEIPPNNLGYTHISPTIEGNGRRGRWARVYTPEERPWQLVGEGVTNGLPVLEAPDRRVTFSTDME